MEILKEKSVLLMLLSIIVVAAFLRLFMLGNNPFVADEFLDINATYGHNQTATWQAWDFNKESVSTRINPASDHRAWLYRIQVSKLFDVSYFPPEEWSARLVSALWGILTTLIIFGVTYSFTRNVWVALIASFLWAVSVPAIEMNRKLRMYSMFAPVFLLFSWTLFQLLESVSSKGKSLLARLFALNYLYLIPVCVLGLLAFHLHPLTGNIVFVLLAYFFSQSARTLWPLEKFNRYGVYATALVSFLIALYLFVPAVAQQMKMLLTLTYHPGYFSHILATYWHPLLGLIFISFGCYFAFYGSTKNRGQVWIALNFLVILGCAVFLWDRNVGAQYIFFIQPFAMMLCALGLFSLWQLFNHHFSTKIFSHAASGLLAVSLLILLLPNYGYFFEENTTYNITSRGETPDYRKVFDYVGDNKRDVDVLVTRNFRNYYYGGHDFTVFDFGSERSAQVIAAEGKVHKITRSILQDIFADNPDGWFVYTDNDERFISKEAIEYARENFVQVRDSSLIRGKVFVYRWGDLAEIDIADEKL